MPGHLREDGNRTRGYGRKQTWSCTLKLRTTLAWHLLGSQADTLLVEKGLGKGELWLYDFV